MNQCFGLVPLVFMGLLSCTNAAGPAPMEAGSADEGSSVRIEIPALSASFLSAAGVESMEAAKTLAPAGSGTRAFIAVSAAKLELFASDGTTQIDGWTMDSSAFNAGLAGGTGSFVQTRNLAPGTGYTIRATLLNAANGTEEASQATVQGISKPFDIVADACSYVLIQCLPINPTVLTHALPSDSMSLLPFSGSYDSPSTIRAGGETWYTFTAASKFTRILAQASAGSQAVLGMFVYEADGITTVENNAVSMGVEPGEGSAAWVTTVPGQVYYIGILNFGSFQRRYIYQYDEPDPTGDQSFTVSFTNAVKDQYENDNTIQSATTLVSGIPQTHSLYPSADVDYFAFTGAGGTSYSFATTSVDSTSTNTVLEIVDSTGTVVLEASNEDKYQDDFSRIESWECPMDGTYYPRVTGSNGGYSLLMETLAPAADLAVVVTPGDIDPYQNVLVGWNAVSGAVAYQLWVSIEIGGELEGPFQAFQEGAEPGPADCQVTENRLSYELSLGPYNTPGAMVIVQISWLSGGAWSPLSSGGSGSTQPKTSIGVSIE